MAGEEIVTLAAPNKQAARKSVSIMTDVAPPCLDKDTRLVAPSLSSSSENHNVEKMKAALLAGSSTRYGQGNEDRHDHPVSPLSSVTSSYHCASSGMRKSRRRNKKRHASIRSSDLQSLNDELDETVASIDSRLLGKHANDEADSMSTASNSIATSDGHSIHTCRNIIGNMQDVRSSNTPNSRGTESVSLSSRLSRRSKRSGITRSSSRHPRISLEEAVYATILNVSTGTANDTNELAMIDDALSPQEFSTDYILQDLVDVSKTETALPALGNDFTQDGDLYLLQPRFQPLATIQSATLASASADDESSHHDTIQSTSLVPSWEDQLFAQSLSEVQDAPVKTTAPTAPVWGESFQYSGSDHGSWNVATVEQESATLEATPMDLLKTLFDSELVVIDDGAAAAYCNSRDDERPDDEAADQAANKNNDAVQDDEVRQANSNPNALVDDDAKDADWTAFSATSPATDTNHWTTFDNDDCSNPFVSTTTSLKSPSAVSDYPLFRSNWKTSETGWKESAGHRECYYV